MLPCEAWCSFCFPPCFSPPVSWSSRSPLKPRGGSLPPSYSWYYEYNPELLERFDELTPADIAACEAAEMGLRHGGMAGLLPLDMRSGRRRQAGAPLGKPEGLAPLPKPPRTGRAEPERGRAAAGEGAGLAEGGGVGLEGRPASPGIHRSPSHARETRGKA